MFCISPKAGRGGGTETQEMSRVRAKNRQSKIQGFLYMSVLIGATTPWVQPQQRAAGEATLNTHISAGDGVHFPPDLLASLSINHNRGGMRHTGENWNWLQVQQLQCVCLRADNIQLQQKAARLITEND